MLQWIVIALIVTCAAAYVLWSFLPLRHRQSLLDLLAARGPLRAAAARHRARLTAPGCSHCSPETRSLHGPASGDRERLARGRPAP